jgi:hypothetical protein
MTNSLLHLFSYLEKNASEFSPIAVKTLEEFLISIMTKGYYFTPSGSIIGAAHIDSVFKINNKTLRIRLITTDVRDEVVIPKLSWKMSANLDQISVGPHDYFRTSISQHSQDSQSENLRKYVISF